MSPVSAGMKNAVPVPTRAGSSRKPQKGGWPKTIQAPRAVSAEARRTSALSIHAPPAEPVAHDATDEQEDHEGNRLGRQHCADFGRRRMA